MKILILASFLFLSIFRLPDNKTLANNSSHLQSIDSSRYAILKFDSKSNYYFDKDAKPTPLTAEDIKKIEILIDKRMAKYNKVEEAIYQKSFNETKRKYPNSIPFDNRIKNPEKYYKQFIAVINSKGEKIVWANCVCEIKDFKYWKRSEVFVDDGGNCFFNLKINLTKGTTYDLMVNGIA